MTGKSRHGKERREFHSKKSKAKRRAAMMSSQQVAAPAPETATPVETPAPPAAEPAPLAKPGAARYPYVAAELRRISILAGIIIIVLIVLSRVLS